MSAYHEIYQFAVACLKKGWSKEKTCLSLGMTEEDRYIINDVYYNYSTVFNRLNSSNGGTEKPFTIIPSDEEDEDEQR